MRVMFKAYQTCIFFLVVAILIIGGHIANCVEWIAKRALAPLVMAAIILSCIYLFLAQLARYGW